MVLQYIVEGHRYNIFEDFGCYPATFNTAIAYPIYFMWPVVIGLASAVYCILTLREFMRRRAQFGQFLSSSSPLTVNRYFRLMALATIDLLFDTPISIYGIYLNLTASPLQPWKGWADAHFQYSAVHQFPALIWRSNYTTVVSLELSRWSIIFFAFVFFGFFGFAEEARRHYRLAYWAVAKRFGVQPPSKPSSLYKGPPRKLQLTKDAVESLPAYVVRPPPETGKHDSFGSSVAPSSAGKSDFTLFESPVLPSFKAEPTCSSDEFTDDGYPSPPPSHPSHFV